MVPHGINTTFGDININVMIKQRKFMQLSISCVSYTCQSLLRIEDDGNSTGQGVAPGTVLVIH